MRHLIWVTDSIILPVEGQLTRQLPSIVGGTSPESQKDRWNLKPEPDLQNSGKRPVRQG